jgi:hypothetical protein
MSKKNIHIVYRSETADWAVKKEGNKRASKVAATKQAAEDLGKALAKKDKVELVIHNEDGQISDKDSFGNDPISVKDTVL